MSELLCPVTQFNNNHYHPLNLCNNGFLPNLQIHTSNCLTITYFKKKMEFWKAYKSNGNEKVLRRRDLFFSTLSCAFQIQSVPNTFLNSVFVVYKLPFNQRNGELMVFFINSRTGLYCKNKFRCIYAKICKSHRNKCLLKYESYYSFPQKHSAQSIKTSL